MVNSWQFFVAYLHTEHTKQKSTLSHALIRVVAAAAAAGAEICRIKPSPSPAVHGILYNQRLHHSTQHGNIG